MFERFNKIEFKKMAGWHALAIFFILSDRFLKVWATLLKPKTDSWFGFNYSLNADLAFSLPLKQILIITVVGLIIVWLGLYYFRLLANGAWQAGLVFALILASISNLFDRIAYGGVIDYLNFGSLTIFNLADALIMFSLGWWLWTEVFHSN